MPPVPFFFGEPLELNTLEPLDVNSRDAPVPELAGLAAVEEKHRSLTARVGELTVLARPGHQEQAVVRVHRVGGQGDDRGGRRAAAPRRARPVSDHEAREVILTAGPWIGRGQHRGDRGDPVSVCESASCTTTPLPQGVAPGVSAFLAAGAGVACFPSPAPHRLPLSALRTRSRNLHVRISPPLLKGRGDKRAGSLPLLLAFLEAESRMGLFRD